jgi:hypothetical protein
MRVIKVDGNEGCHYNCPFYRPRPALTNCSAASRELPEPSERPDWCPLYDSDIMVELVGGPCAPELE